MTIETIMVIGWVAFGIGILFAISGLIFDIDIGFDSLSIGCFATVFGGSLLIFGTWLTAVNAILAVSLAIATILTILVHFYIVPMKKSEASLSYNIADLKGSTGEVITAIPFDGVGEILIDTGLGVSSRSASSYDKTDIPEGSKILVIDIVDNLFVVTIVEN